MNSNIRRIIGVLTAAAEASQTVSRPNAKTFEALFSTAIKKALDKVNNDGADPFDFEGFVITNFLILAEQEGYTLTEINIFLDELQSDD